jgi:hypothetical protein
VSHGRQRTDTEVDHTRRSTILTQKITNSVTEMPLSSDPAAACQAELIEGEADQALPLPYRHLIHNAVGSRI